MYVYKQTDFSPPLYTVGYYTPSGEWVPESDHESKDSASDRVHYLNGGNEK